MKKALFAMFVAGTFVWSSCTPKKPDPVVPVTPTYDNSFTIDGGGFKKTVVNFKSVTLSAGAYNSSNKLTEVNLEGNTGDTLSMVMNMNFDGIKTGTYPFTSVKNYILLTINTPNAGTSGDYNVLGGSGTITVNRFETVGGKIGGTFGGNFSGPNGITYTISNGTFLVVRSADK